MQITELSAMEMAYLMRDLTRMSLSEATFYFELTIKNFGKEAGRDFLNHAVADKFNELPLNERQKLCKKYAK